MQLKSRHRGPGRRRRRRSGTRGRRRRACTRCSPSRCRTRPPSTAPAPAVPPLPSYRLRLRHGRRRRRRTDACGTGRRAGRAPSPGAGRRERQSAAAAATAPSRRRLPWAGSCAAPWWYCGPSPPAAAAAPHREAVRPVLQPRAEPSAERFHAQSQARCDTSLRFRHIPSQSQQRSACVLPSVCLYSCMQLATAHAFVAAAHLLSAGVIAGGPIGGGRRRVGDGRPRVGARGRPALRAGARSVQSAALHREILLCSSHSTATCAG